MNKIFNILATRSRLAYEGVAQNSIKEVMLASLVCSIPNNPSFKVLIRFSE